MTARRRELLDELSRELGAAQGEADGVAVLRRAVRFLNGDVRLCQSRGGVHTARTGRVDDIRSFESRSNARKDVAKLIRLVLKEEQEEAEEEEAQEKEEVVAVKHRPTKLRQSFKAAITLVSMQATVDKKPARDYEARLKARLEDESEAYLSTLPSRLVLLWRAREWVTARITDWRSSSKGRELKIGELLSNDDMDAKWILETSSRLRRLLECSSSKPAGVPRVGDLVRCKFCVEDERFYWKGAGPLGTVTRFMANLGHAQVQVQGLLATEAFWLPITALVKVEEQEDETLKKRRSAREELQAALALWEPMVAGRLSRVIRGRRVLLSLEYSGREQHWRATAWICGRRTRSRDSEDVSAYMASDTTSGDVPLEFLVEGGFSPELTGGVLWRDARRAEASCYVLGLADVSRGALVFPNSTDLEAREAEWSYRTDFVLKDVAVTAEFWTTWRDAEERRLGLAVELTWSSGNIKGTHSFYLRVTEWVALNLGSELEWLEDAGRAVLCEALTRKLETRLGTPVFVLPRSSLTLTENAVIWPDHVEEVRAQHPYEREEASRDVHHQGAADGEVLYRHVLRLATPAVSEVTLQRWLLTVRRSGGSLEVKARHVPSGAHFTSHVTLADWCDLGRCRAPLQWFAREQQVALARRFASLGLRDRQTCLLEQEEAGFLGSQFKPRPQNPQTTERPYAAITTKPPEAALTIEEGQDHAPLQKWASEFVARAMKKKNRSSQRALLAAFPKLREFLESKRLRRLLGTVNLESPACKFLSAAAAAQLVFKLWADSEAAAALDRSREQEALPTVLEGIRLDRRKHELEALGAKEALRKAVESEFKLRFLAEETSRLLETLAGLAPTEEWPRFVREALRTTPTCFFENIVETEVPTVPGLSEGEARRTTRLNVESTLGETAIEALRLDVLRQQSREAVREARLDRVGFAECLIAQSQLRSHGTSFAAAAAAAAARFSRRCCYSQPLFLAARVRCVGDGSIEADVYDNGDEIRLFTPKETLVRPRELLGDDISWLYSTRNARLELALRLANWLAKDDEEALSPALFAAPSCLFRLSRRANNSSSSSNVVLRPTSLLLATAVLRRPRVVSSSSAMTVFCSLIDSGDRLVLIARDALGLEVARKQAFLAVKNSSMLLEKESIQPMLASPKERQRFLRRLVDGGGLPGSTPMSDDALARRRGNAQLQKCISDPQWAVPDLKTTEYAADLSKRKEIGLGAMRDDHNTIDNKGPVHAAESSDEEEEDDPDVRSERARRVTLAAKNTARGEALALAHPHYRGAEVAAKSQLRLAIMPEAGTTPLSRDAAWRVERRRGQARECYKRAVAAAKDLLNGPQQHKRRRRAFDLLGAAVAAERRARDPLTDVARRELYLLHAEHSAANGHASAALESLAEAGRDLSNDPPRWRLLRVKCLVQANHGDAARAELELLRGSLGEAPSSLVDDEHPASGVDDEPAPTSGVDDELVELWTALAGDRGIDKSFTGRVQVEDSQNSAKIAALTSQFASHDTEMATLKQEKIAKSKARKLKTLAALLGSEEPEEEEEEYESEYEFETDSDYSEDEKSTKEEPQPVDRLLELCRLLVTPDDAPVILTALELEEQLLTKRKKKKKRKLHGVLASLATAKVDQWCLSHPYRISSKQALALEKTIYKTALEALAMRKKSLQSRVQERNDLEQLEGVEAVYLQVVEANTSLKGDRFFGLTRRSCLLRVEEMEEAVPLGEKSQGHDASLELSPAEQAAAIMTLCDTADDRDAKLTVEELQVGLLQTEFNGFISWLLKNQNQVFSALDSDNGGSLDERELTVAITSFLEARAQSQEEVPEQEEEEEEAVVDDTTARIVPWEVGWTERVKATTAKVRWMSVFRLPPPLRTEKWPSSDHIIKLQRGIVEEQAEKPLLLLEEGEEEPLEKEEEEPAVQPASSDFGRYPALLEGSTLEVARPAWTLIVEVWSREARMGSVQQCLGEARIGGAALLGMLSELPKPTKGVPPTSGPSRTVSLPLGPRPGAAQVERNRSRKGSIQVRMWQPPIWALDDRADDVEEEVDEEEDVVDEVAGLLEAFQLDVRAAKMNRKKGVPLTHFRPGTTEGTLESVGAAMPWQASRRSRNKTPRPAEQREDYSASSVEPQGTVFTEALGEFSMTVDDDHAEEAELTIEEKKDTLLEKEFFNVKYYQ